MSGESLSTSAGENQEKVSSQRWDELEDWGAKNLEGATPTDRDWNAVKDNLEQQLDGEHSAKISEALKRAFDEQSNDSGYHWMDSDSGSEGGSS